MTSATEALSQWKKVELNRTYQFGEKSQKISENKTLLKSCWMGWKSLPGAIAGALLWSANNTMGTVWKTQVLLINVYILKSASYE